MHFEIPIGKLYYLSKLHMKLFSCENSTKFALQVEIKEPLMLLIFMLFNIF